MPFCGSKTSRTRLTTKSPFDFGSGNSSTRARAICNNWGITFLVHAITGMLRDFAVKYKASPSFDPDETIATVGFRATYSMIMAVGHRCKACDSQQ
jgi:hypothetical protein